MSGGHAIRVALVGVAAALLLLSPAPAAGGADARAARSCTPPDYPGSGYFYSLSVKRVSCATGRKVALAHYRCRTRSGRAGRCHQRVLGYTCREQRRSIPTEINSRVTCRRGGKRVVPTYQQNT
jgi:hypothetical protein